MNPVLIVVETRYGHCGKIADHIVDRVRSKGLEIYLEQSPGAHPVPVSEFSAVIVVAAVYNRELPHSIRRFVREHAYALSSCPSAFVCVSLGAASTRMSARRSIGQLMELFLEETGWRRRHLLMTGGAIAYPLYTPSMRRWVKLAAWVFGLPTDTSRTHDLTNWRSVDDLVDDIVSDVEIVRHRTPLRVA